MDLHEVHLKERVKAFAMDVYNPKVAETVTGALGGLADVVLSDLAPSVSGVWELDQTRQVDLTLHVLELCGSVLRPRGDAFLKLFEGEQSQEVREEMRVRFRAVRALKPAASRSASSELYYYCQGFAEGRE